MPAMIKMKKMNIMLKLNIFILDDNKKNTALGNCV